MSRASTSVSTLSLRWLLLLGLLQGASAQFNVFSIGGLAISQVFGALDGAGAAPAPSSSSTVVLVGPPVQRTTSQQVIVQPPSSSSVFVAPKPSVAAPVQPSTSSFVPVVIPSSTSTPTPTPSSTSHPPPPRTSAPVVTPVLATTSSKVSSSLRLTSFKAPVTSSSSLVVSTSSTPSSSSSSSSSASLLETSSLTVSQAEASATATIPANGSHGPKASVVAPAVIGSLIGLALIILLVFFLIRRRRQRDDDDSFDYGFREKDFHFTPPAMAMPDHEDQSAYRGFMPIPPVTTAARTATYPSDSTSSRPSPASPTSSAAIVAGASSNERSRDNPFMSEQERRDLSPANSASSLTASTPTPYQTKAVLPEAFPALPERSSRRRSGAVPAASSPETKPTGNDAVSNRSGSPVSVVRSPGGLMVMNPDKAETETVASKEEEEDITALPVFKSSHKRQSASSGKAVQAAQAERASSRRASSEAGASVQPGASPLRASRSSLPGIPEASAATAASQTSEYSERQSTGPGGENPFDQRYSTTSSNRSSSSAVLYADLDAPLMPMPLAPTYRGPLDSHSTPSYPTPILQPQYQTPYQQQQAFQQRGPPRVSQWRGARQNDMPSIAESYDHDHGHGNRGYPPPPRRGRGRGGYGPGYGPARGNTSRQPPY